MFVVVFAFVAVPTPYHFKHVFAFGLSAVAWSTIELENFSKIMLASHLGMSYMFQNRWLELDHVACTCKYSKM